MAQPSRASSTAILSFADFQFPIKVFAVAQDKAPVFVKVHGECGARLRQEFECTECKESACTSPGCAPRAKNVPAKHRVRALQVERDNLVPFSEDEILSLRSARTDELEISEFHPEETVDSILFAKTFYLVPADDGAGYDLLRQVMARTKSVGLGRFYRNGDVRFVHVQRHGERGLLLHELHEANEIRAFPDFPPPEEPVTAAELDKALDRVETMVQTQFRPEAFIDPFPARIFEAAEKKQSPTANARKGNVANMAARSPSAARSSQVASAPAEKVLEESRSGPASVHALPVKPSVAEDAAVDSQRSGSPGA